VYHKCFEGKQLVRFALTTDANDRLDRWVSSRQTAASLNMPMRSGACQYNHQSMSSLFTDLELSEPLKPEADGAKVSK
jgi:hypothetical protein